MSSVPPPSLLRLIKPLTPLSRLAFAMLAPLSLSACEFEPEVVSEPDPAGTTKVINLCDNGEGAEIPAEDPGYFAEGGLAAGADIAEYNPCGYCEPEYVCEVVRQEERCTEPSMSCSCDPATGEDVCVEIAARCWQNDIYDCVLVPVAGDEPPPAGTEPPPAGDEPPPAGDEPPPAGGEVSACDTPNPSLTCLTTGCDEGELCEPSDEARCVPSSCSCDETLGTWACTEDCGQPFACVRAPVDPFCPDADGDGVCDVNDSTCEVDGSILNCRRLAPECPRGSVPVVVDGCYNDSCVSWEECSLRAGNDVPTACGARLGDTCSPNEFCLFTPEAMCGAADQTGLCTPLTPNALCPDLFEPVCGCDQQTYPNACEAMRAGTSVLSVGECEPVEPISCGGFRPMPVECPQGTFCHYEPEAMCGAADAPGQCVPHDPTMPCPAIYMPVCGCNQQTYGNECEAMRAGTSVFSIGPCESEPISCGGFAGLLCPEGLICVDDPSDDCDPARGGADCIGVCVAR